MAKPDFLAECKIGLGIDVDTTDLDGPVKQKIVAVQSFLKNGGVKDEVLLSDAAIGAIVVGVTDLWDLKSGEIKFSPVFYTLANQLAVR